MEFLLTEGLAEGRDGAQDAIDAGRDRFMEKQLRAAIRRRPEVALDVLEIHSPDLLS
ncbi:hypothetical protein [Pseudonocardia sp. N23]|uniref:hypothetical protein n=1 Tax=Pseudonocardia sp. N23 TaxID=1987376 RepID=UPI001558B7CE|nr:hypothetical protein [Pseudonocardia sp. N23]